MGPSGFHSRATPIIYISDLSENLVSNDNLFEDDFSVFSVFKNVDDSGINLDNNSWTFQWKMIFNSNPMKEYPEIIFSLKTQTLNHPLVFLSDSLYPD